MVANCAALEDQVYAVRSAVSQIVVHACSSAVPAMPSRRGCGHIAQI
jgi:hypothetical protein